MVDQRLNFIQFLPKFSGIGVMRKIKTFLAFGEL